MTEEKLPKDAPASDVKNTFAYECLSFIQDKKERGYDAKDILEELEEFLQAVIGDN